MNGLLRRTGLGFEQVSSISSAKGLSGVGSPTPAIPAGAHGVELIASGQNVRWRDDGTDPTASVGMLLVVGVPYFYMGNLSAIKFIETTATATVGVRYFKNAG